MPSRGPRLCGCGRIVPGGERCPCQERRLADLRTRTDAARPSAAARGYDAEWRDLRRRFLAAHPRCSVPGCGQAATQVDHVVSVRERPDLRLDPRNLRGLCRGHHAARTARDQGFGRAARDDR